MGTSIGIDRREGHRVASDLDRAARKRRLADNLLDRVHDGAHARGVLLRDFGRRCAFTEYANADASRIRTNPNGAFTVHSDHARSREPKGIRKAWRRNVFE